MLIIKGPYCFGCGGRNVVKRHFWGTVAWDKTGTIEGNVALDVCLDCSGDIGSRCPISKAQETKEES